MVLVFMKFNISYSLGAKWALGVLFIQIFLFILAIFSRISLNNKFFSLAICVCDFCSGEGNAKLFQMTEKQWVLCSYRGSRH